MLFVSGKILLALTLRTNSMPPRCHIATGWVVLLTSYYDGVVIIRSDQISSGLPSLIFRVEEERTRAEVRFVGRNWSEEEEGKL